MAKSSTPRGRRLLRTVLHRLADDDRTVRFVAGLRDEAERALDDARYGADYYRGDAISEGYGHYARETSHADRLATLMWTWIDARRSLDVGCAAGFLVEALIDLGVDAAGVDLSSGAFDLAAPHIRPRLAIGDLRTGLDRPDRSADLVTAFETLEHVRPRDVPVAVAELARVSSSWVVVSIPSFGPNPSGPAGWFEGKVRDDRIDHYRALGPAFDGPVPFDDLAVDGDGLPVKGHLTIASYDWWTARFAEVGLHRCHDLEIRMHVDLARYGLTEYVCLYVLRHAHVTEPIVPVRSPEDIADAEQRSSLTEHGENVLHEGAAHHMLRMAGLDLRPGLEPPT